MGCCMSAKIKAESPVHAGKNGRKLSNQSSKVSSASGLNTPRTEGEILQSANMHSFAFDDLRTATRNFRPDSVLGDGGFGCVFKGWIDETTFAAARPGTGIVIAVKRLNQVGFHGHKEWLAGINYLGQVHHPNLVKLIGYWLRDDHRLLVYEFMPCGSLENHLFRSSFRRPCCFIRFAIRYMMGSTYFQPLSWGLRVQVALGAAKGLAYLHSPEIKVIYSDFKTSNILLDSDYNAKLSDFGLAKDELADGRSHVSTRVMDTHGYAAPEYMQTGHFTARNNVYSFGVVLLEVMTGRRVLDRNRPHGEHNLVDWAKPQLTSKRRILHLMDPRMEGKYSLGGVLRTAKLVVKCLAVDPKLRPKMDEVVKLLEDIQERENSSVSTRSEPVHSSQRSSSFGSGGQRRFVEVNCIGKAKSYPRPIGV